MTHRRKPMMAGNWKMYKTVSEATAFLTAFSQQVNQLKQSGADLPDILLCPPFTSLYAMSEVLKTTPAPIGLGGQNMESHDEGAYTGEISPAMLKDAGAGYVLLGHSERRQYYGETDAGINAKIRAALNQGLTPIVCVGESLEQRESGSTDRVITNQVDAAIAGYHADELQKMVFAYEPVWAIGTGKVCEADEAGRVCDLIRERLDNPEIRVLYGGSVNPGNVKTLLDQPAIDGGLVGGASLTPENFIQLVQATMAVGV